MKVLRVAIALCVLSLFALPARSQHNASGNTRTGNSLIEACQLAVSAQDNPTVDRDPLDNLKMGYCYGISNGVAGTLTLSREACVPDSVTIGQEARVIEKFLQDHPAKLNQPDVTLAIEAMEKAFPCNK